MSRLEDALKKATELRNEAGERDSAHSHAAPEEAPAQASAVPPEVLERVRNQHMLVSMNDMCSLAAEEFRKLKQNLVRLTKKKGFNNTLLVTSGTSGEGKSVTSTNLAISLAQEFDHTVLLIDGDLRRPSCHELLCVENRRGLSDCLLEGADISSAMIKTGIGKLTFVPAGTPLANPAELLASNRMESMLREMKSRYSDRYIIIDSPPVLPFAETRILGSLVDSVILVIKEGRLSKYELRETLEAMSGSNIIGAVYTQATASGANNRFGGYSRYHYYYQS